MSNNNESLVPREGSGPRLIDGPRPGQRSLYQQQVLDEDTYTEALSHIITRDFFPNLPHLHATNAYLTALTNNDPELLSSSIRRLAALAKEKEDAQGGSSSRSRADRGGEEDRRREFDNAGTPYMNIPGRKGKAPARTPVGARGWDTPVMRNGESTRRRANREEEDDEEEDELEGDYGQSRAGPLDPKRKKKRKVVENRLRDDLPLDLFQANYTSEDNASFAQIVELENEKRREERWSWAWEAEKKANQRRIEGEEQRKMILDKALNGDWRVNAEGKRLTGGLSEGGRDRDEGEAWKDKRLITAAPARTADQVEGDRSPNHSGSSTIQALIKRDDGKSQALIVGSSSQAGDTSSKLSEQPVPDDHPLNRALTEAGLPATALVSNEDGAIVPRHEVTSGEGDGRGRGDEESERRLAIEKHTMGDEGPERLSLGGSGLDQWEYKAMNNLMFTPNSNSKPYPSAITRKASDMEKSRQAPKEIKYANTRLPDEDEAGPSKTSAGSSRRGSSPARSWVDAAVKGTPYRPGGGDAMPTVNNYPLLPNDPSPSPTDLPSLLTWGTLLATPRALDGGSDADPLDTSGPSFKLPESKRRDELGRKLADKASRSMNARAQQYTPRTGGNSALRALADRTQRSIRGTPRGSGAAGEMLPPSSTPRRENLTPAGKRLLQKSLGVSKSMMGTSGRNRSAAMEKGSGWGLGGKGGLGGRDVGSMSWTPSPARRKP